MEKCDRCGHVGEDRRTLWMAAMLGFEEEMFAPFEVYWLYGVAAKCRRATHNFAGRLLPYWRPVVPVRGQKGPEKYGRRFYTLRVCKRCRGDWFLSIKQWWNAHPVSYGWSGEDEEESYERSGVC